MNLIVETDLGHDPDDFFALCYLQAAGARIKALLVEPGDPDQISIAKFFCREVGLNIPVAAAHPNRKELSSGSIHHRLLKHYGCSLRETPDCTSTEAIVAAGEVDAFFVIGPATSTARYLRENPTGIQSLTMQGGFLPYHLHPPQVRLEKFSGKQAVRTFNLMNDPEAAKVLLAADIPNKRFVGKNVCHTIEFDGVRLEEFLQPTNRAGELFAEAARFYFEKHRAKKFHDPTAAVCLLHPEIGGWVRGNPVLTEHGYTTEVSETGAHVLAEIDRDALWRHLTQLT